MDEITGGSCPPASEVSLQKSHAMTKDTIRKIGNAIVHFSDPFERTVDEVLAEPIFRLPRRSRGNVRFDRNALKKHFNVCGRHILDKYDAALAKGADPDESFLQCAEGLAAIAGVDTGMDFVQDGDLTFGIIQHVINKAEALAYVGCFWDHVGSRFAEIDEKRLVDWFLAPDSPRHRFKNRHCLMNDEMTDRVVREYRKCGTNEVIKKGRWWKVSCRRLSFMETGEPDSIAWYGKFQTMAEELAGHLGLYPIEYLFCNFPERK
jgi:hypothetical protein